MLPSLDTSRLAATRCLILGAGTLGCQVARNLMVRPPTQLPILNFRCTAAPPWVVTQDSRITNRVRSGTKAVRLTPGMWHVCRHGGCGV